MIQVTMREGISLLLMLVILAVFTGFWGCFANVTAQDKSSWGISTDTRERLGYILATILFAAGAPCLALGYEVTAILYRGYSLPTVFDWIVGAIVSAVSLSLAVRFAIFLHNNYGLRREIINHS
jgi:hypothetical protein